MGFGCLLWYLAQRQVFVLHKFSVFDFEKNIVFDKILVTIGILSNKNIGFDKLGTRLRCPHRISVLAMSQKRKEKDRKKG